ncbi:MAG: DUF1570 domain-containing protein [Myxococcaceae bacterium]|jgi:hypothetical protein|nr:DUF1570 domain-containing protein [Myxococcaceae bacterium]
MRVVWCGLAALLASGCVKRVECEVHGGAGVRELVTDHFVISSELPDAELELEARRLELLWDTFATFFRAEVPRARIPVVVLQDAETVESFAEGYAGFVSRRGPQVLVVGAPAEPGATNVNAHELTHLVSNFMLPRQPRWVAEGLATYFEDATFVDERTVTMGRWNKNRASEAFVSGVLSIDELMEWNNLRFDDAEVRYYASAWAWVHYLSNHDEARLVRLFEGLRGTRPVSEVVREVFPPGEARRLEDEVTAYLAAAKFRGFQTSLRRVPSQSAVRTLEPWEVHRLRGQLFLRNERAEAEELATAVSLAPTPLPASLAVLEAERTKQPIGSLLATYPEAPEVLAALDDDAAKEQRSAFERAVLANPDDASLRLAAARVALEVGEVATAETHAAVGLALAPWSSELASVLLSVAMKQGRCDEAALRLSRFEALLPEKLSEATRKSVETLRTQVRQCGGRTL